MTSSHIKTMIFASFISLIGFVKSSLIHASNFATLISDNFVDDEAITLKFSPNKLSYISLK